MILQGPNLQVSGSIPEGPALQSINIFMDVFQKFPQFIDNDIRTGRANPGGYPVTYDWMIQRHTALLPQELIHGKSVLDLGCCVGATGAWALELGAASYTGVEIQKKFVDQANQNFQQCFPDSNWNIIESSLENFFKSNTEKYDLVYAGGILYSSLYYQELLANIVAITNYNLVIESKTPGIVIEGRKQNIKNIDEWPLVEYSRSVGMVHEEKDNLNIHSAIPSLPAITLLLEEFGFFQSSDYTNIKVNNYGLRYGAIFEKKLPVKKYTTEAVYYSPDKKTTPWKTIIPDEWEFNENIAKTFVRHATMHIPDYKKVINLSVSICNKILVNAEEDRIIDVGCATGETINELYKNGYCNLVGVDASQAMINECNKNYAYYVLSEDFPLEHGPYHAVLCNWTLHFIKEKRNYLEKIYQGLKLGGFVLLTDKTENQGLALDLYHDFKRSCFVTESEIVAKAESVKNKMYIDCPVWYINTLQDIGFTNVSILNAAPCFTTFIGFKTQ